VIDAAQLSSLAGVRFLVAFGTLGGEGMDEIVEAIAICGVCPVEYVSVDECGETPACVVGSRAAVGARGGQAEL
jgi:hypothetical protein